MSADRRPEPTPSEAEGAPTAARRGFRPTRRALFGLLLTLVSLTFVAWVVPIRDRCLDPGAAEAAPKRALTRDASGCTLTGRGAPPRRLTLEECGSLRCEPGLATAVGRSRADVMALAALLYAIGTFVWAVRWHLLLRLARLKTSLLQTWRVTVEAQAGGILLPGGVGGDALRIAAFRSAGGPLSVVASSVLLDRFIGLATLAGLGAAVGHGAGVATWFLAAIPLGLAVGLLALRLAPFARLVERIRFLGFLTPALRYVASPGAPAAIARATLASLLLSGLQLVVIRVLVLALGGAPTQEHWIWAGSAMSFMVGALPALPGGWGTADAAFVFFFAKAGLPPSIALATSLEYRMFWYLSGLVGAALRLAVRAEQPDSPPNGAA